MGGKLVERPSIMRSADCRAGQISYIEENHGNVRVRVHRRLGLQAHLQSR